MKPPRLQPRRHLRPRRLPPRPCTAVFAALALLPLQPALAGDATAMAPMPAAPALAPASSSATPFGPAMQDQAVFAHALLDQFEAQASGAGTALAWEGEAWVGSDRQRLWLRSGGTLAGSRGRDSQNELLYARPVSPYFDLQTGVRYDLGRGPGRGWAALGIEGLAPYFVQVALTAYASDTGHYAARLRLSVEPRLTEAVVAEPQLQIDAYRIGRSQLQAGLRLRYEITRQFAPYLGVTYGSALGHGAAAGTAAGATPAAPAAAAPAIGWRALIGLRTWL